VEKEIAKLQLDRYYSLSQAMPFLPFKARWYAARWIELGTLRAVVQSGDTPTRNRYLLLGRWVKKFTDDYKKGKYAELSRATLYDRNPKNVLYFRYGVEELKHIVGKHKMKTVDELFAHLMLENKTHGRKIKTKSNSNAA